MSKIVLQLRVNVVKSFFSLALLHHCIYSARLYTQRDSITFIKFFPIDTFSYFTSYFEILNVKHRYPHSSRLCVGSCKPTLNSILLFLLNNSSALLGQSHYLPCESSVCSQSSLPLPGAA